jgi:hypothetical protein
MLKALIGILLFLMEAFRGLMKPIIRLLGAGLESWLGSLDDTSIRAQLVMDDSRGLPPLPQPTGSTHPMVS